MASFLNMFSLNWETLYLASAPCHEPQATFTVTSPRLPIPSQPKVYYVVASHEQRNSM